jgi:hypothetical protein
MTKFTTPRNRQVCRSGAAVVELAITLPVFVLILFATFLQQSLEICAYQGARIALIPSSTSAKVNSACATILADRKVKSASVSVSPSNYESQPYGTLILVRVTAPCNSNSPFSPWFYGGRSLTGEVTLMKEY